MVEVDFGGKPYFLEYSYFLVILLYSVLYLFWLCRIKMKDSAVRRPPPPQLVVGCLDHAHCLFLIN